MKILKWLRFRISKSYRTRLDQSLLMEFQTMLDGVPQSEQQIKDSNSQIQVQKVEDLVGMLTSFKFYFTLVYLIWNWRTRIQRYRPQGRKHITFNENAEVQLFDSAQELYNRGAYLTSNKDTYSFDGDELRTLNQRLEVLFTHFFDAVQKEREDFYASAGLIGSIMRHPQQKLILARREYKNYKVIWKEFWS